MQLWLNGKLTDNSAGRIDPADRGLLLGDGVFTTILSFDSSLFRPDLHLGRLRHDAGVLAVQIPYEEPALKEAARAVLKANNLETGIAAVRLTVTRGPAPRGLLPPDPATPTMLITAVPHSVPNTPATTVLASTRRNENSVTSRIKSLNYLDNIIARMEADWAGADDAILLNNAGNIACASAANIFLVRNEKLYTPGIDDGVLPGVMRLTVFDLAEQDGLSVEEKGLTPDDLKNADEAFLTSSLIGIRPLTLFDRTPIGTKKTGPVTARLLKRLRTLIRS